MAHIHGNIANYPASKRHRLVMIGCAVALAAEFALGFCVGFALASRTWWIVWLFVLICGSIAFFALRWLDRHEPQLDAYRRGADGEHRVADELKKLSDTYHVFHGIETPVGDIDHLVIGPTGVFALDAKNWKGSVSVRDGQLMHNGHPADRNPLRSAVCRAMELRTLLGYAHNGEGPFIQAALVFVGTQLNIPPNSTGHTICLPAESILAFIEHPPRPSPSSALITDCLNRAHDLSPISHEPD